MEGEAGAILLLWMGPQPSVSSLGRSWMGLGAHIIPSAWRTREVCCSLCHK